MNTQTLRTRVSAVVLSLVFLARDLRQARLTAAGLSEQRLL